MQQTFADAELTGPDGPVGSVRLTYMVPDTDVGPSLEIENADERVHFENVQKTSSFDVRIYKGTCDSLGEQIHSKRCNRCTNSMGIKILESRKKMTLAGDGSDGDIAGKMLVLYDYKRNSKLACGEIKLRQ